jgi:glycosyltransferase involved in cell wall biosynthesis
MGLPVVTSDLDFSRAICGDAALYFAPREAAAAADQILALLASPALWARLTDRGRQQLQQLPTPRDRYLSYVALLRNLVDGEELTLPCGGSIGRQHAA